MAEADLVVRMVSQGEAAVIDSVLKLAAAWSKTEEATGKAGQEARKAAREDAALTREAAKVRETLISGQQRYNQEVEKLSTLLKRGKLSQDEYNRAVNQAKEEHGGLERSATSALGPKLIGQLGAAAAAYMSVSTAIRAVTGALEHQRQAEREAAQSHLSTADAQAEALANLSAATDKEQAQVVSKVETIAANLKPAGGLGTAWKTFSAALSGAGGRVEEAVPATEAALRFAPTNAETARQIAAAMPDLSAMTKMPAMANLGYMTEIGRMAVSTNQQQVSGYLVPAAKTLGAFGASPEVAAATVAAVQKAMGQRDVEGRLTSTAVLQLAKQMEEQLPEVAAAGGEFQGFDAQGRPIEGGKAPIKTGLKTFTERLKFLQENKQAREQFLQQASFEAPSMVAMQELLGAREGRTKTYFQENLAGIAPREKWASIAEERIARNQRTTTQGIAGLERSVTSTTEQLQQGPLGVSAAIAGVLSKEKADALLRASGAGYVDTKVEDFAFSAKELTSGEAEKRFADLMQRRIRQLRTKRVSDIVPGFGPGGMGMVQQRDMPNTDPAQLAAADSLQKGLDDILGRARTLREGALQPNPQAPPPGPADVGRGPGMSAPAPTRIEAPAEPIDAKTFNRAAQALDTASRRLAEARFPTPSPTLSHPDVDR